MERVLLIFWDPKNIKGERLGREKATTFGKWQLINYWDDFYLELIPRLSSAHGSVKTRGAAG